MVIFLKIIIDQEGADEVGDYSTLLNSDSESDDDGLPTVQVVSVKGIDLVSDYMFNGYIEFTNFPNLNVGFYLFLWHFIQDSYEAIYSSLHIIYVKRYYI